jgi:hypothetical protein
MLILNKDMIRKIRRILSAPQPLYRPGLTKSQFEVRRISLALVCSPRTSYAGMLSPLKRSNRQVARLAISCGLHLANVEVDRAQTASLNRDFCFPIYSLNLRRGLSSSRSALYGMSFRWSANVLSFRPQSRTARCRRSIRWSTCNAVSLACAISIAVFDLDQGIGNLTVRHATGTETYVTFADDTETRKQSR